VFNEPLIQLKFKQVPTQKKEFLLFHLPRSHGSLLIGTPRSDFTSPKIEFFIRGILISVLERKIRKGKMLYWNDVISQEGKPMSKKKKIIIFAVSGIGFLLVALQIEYMLRCNQTRKKLAGNIRTTAQIGFLVEGFCRVSNIEYDRPITTERIISWIDDHDYEDVFTVNQDLKQILDAWDTPIVITYEGTDIYKFVSFGANRKDDHGQGDDIVRIFDVSGDQAELVEKQ